MAKFTAHSIAYYYKDYDGNTVGTPSTAFGALTTADLPLNTETSGDDSGGIHDAARYIVSQIPEFTFTTKRLDDILGLTGPNGACFEGLSPTDGITIYGQVVSDCKDKPVATANAAFQITKGLIRTTAINATRGEDVTASFTIDPIWDGANSPIIALFAGVTLPDLTIQSDDVYTLGNSVIANQTILDPTGINLDLGLTIFDKMPALGQVWPDTVGVQKAQPVMTVTTRSPSIFNTTGAGNGLHMLGSAADPVDTIVQFKKRSEINAFALNNANVHMNYKMHGLFIPENPFSSSGINIAELSARVEGTEDVGNAPLAFAFLQQYDPTL